MKFLRLLRGNWRLLLAALTAAGIVHIWTTLNAVQNDEATGYRRLASALAVNQISYLPPVTSQNQRLPFMMPNRRYAICRYDARRAPVRIRAELPAPGWSLSLHRPNGDNFMYFPGTNERVTKLNLVLEPAAKSVVTTSLGALAPAQKAAELEVTSAAGLAIYKAPVSSLAVRRLVDEQLSTFECFQEHRRN